MVGREGKTEAIGWDLRVIYGWCKQQAEGMRDLLTSFCISGFSTEPINDSLEGER